MIFCVVRILWEKGWKCPEGPLPCYLLYRARCPGRETFAIKARNESKWAAFIEPSYDKYVLFFHFIFWLLISLLGSLSFSLSICSYLSVRRYVAKACGSDRLSIYCVYSYKNGIKEHFDRFFNYSDSQWLMRIIWKIWKIFSKKNRITIEN